MTDQKPIYKKSLNQSEARQLIPILAERAGIDERELESMLRRIRIAERREQIRMLRRPGSDGTSTQLRTHERILARLERQEETYQTGRRARRVG